MKRFCSLRNAVLFLAIIGLTGCGSLRSEQARMASDPSVLAVFGDEAITVGEFERQYARSVGGPEVAREHGEEEYAEFLDRYVNFRLKVRAAERMGIDRLDDLREEIRSYRTNLARPYLVERAVLDPLVRTLYERRQEMVNASHILIRVEPNASPADTLAAYERMAELVETVRSGTPFGEVARRHSEDPSAQAPEGTPGSAGQLGYFSAGRMVTEFEDMAFQTPVGQLSPIFRTQFGYHVLKVSDRRPTEADIHVAHIMLRPEVQGSEARARALADSLVAAIHGGADFAALAREYSDDTQTGQNGGDLGFMSFDMPIVQSFKDAAFALEETGAVSDAVRTQFGYHIIKLIDRRAPKSFEESYDELKALVTRSNRVREAETAFARDVRARAGSTLDDAVLAQLQSAFAVDTVYQAFRLGTVLDENLGQRRFATLGSNAYDVSDLARWATEAPRAAVHPGLARELANAFLDDRALDLEASVLEDRDPEFRALMNEFRDGLVLFRLMEDSVWTAAAQDTVGLKAYHAPRADRYRFPDRVRVVAVYASTDSVLQAALAGLDQGHPASELREILQFETTQLRIDTTYIAGRTNSMFDRALDLEEGGRTAPFRDQRRHVALIHAGIDPARVKTFQEARAEVINEYQEQLEERLMTRLREEFGARLFPERLSRAFAAPPTASPHA
jgi:peptidyl-prolyl cis-trans isomerase SurA